MRALVAALMSPLALIRLPARAWGFLLGYLLAAAAVLFGVRAVLVAHKDSLENLVLGYLFPDSWHFAARMVIERFFAAQERIVVINLVIATALMTVTVSLFWLKELVSAAFEKDGKLVSKPNSEHPLWEQAWQEIKLLVLFFAVQGSIFWIGYQPSAVFKKTAIALSYLFLFFTYAIDFVSPIFQRHQGHYSRILKVLASNGLGSLAFGAIFALPTIIAGRIWAHHAEWSFETALTVVFGINVVTIAWACVAGTWFGSRLMDDFESTRRSHWLVRMAASLALLVVVASNAYAFGGVGLALHHKSQILKCEYDVVWTSFGFERPGIMDLLDDELEISLHIDVDIENPTKFDVAIEDNRLEIRNKGDLVATTKLAPLAVPAGEKRRQTIEFAMKVTPSMVRKGRELLDKDNWKMVLYLEVAPGFEFPIYLYGYDDE
ncbi:MAG: hypothetical protein KJO07_08310 [Deltaproteobacteria bacterium]|nr:hypothetical protein [Deltaproteobacteria bacterium]